jgi:hypothetical protein
MKGRQVIDDDTAFPVDVGHRVLFPDRSGGGTFGMVTAPDVDIHAVQVEDAGKDEPDLSGDTADPGNEIEDFTGRFPVAVFVYVVVKIPVEAEGLDIAFSENVAHSNSPVFPVRGLLPCHILPGFSAIDPGSP